MSKRQQFKLDLIELLRVHAENVEMASELKLNQSDIQNFDLMLYTFMDNYQPTSNVLRQQ